LPNDTSRWPSTERSKTIPRKKEHTRRGRASTSPQYTDSRPSRKSHRRKQDGWSRVRSFFSRSRKSPSSRPKKARRTQTSKYDKSRRETKKKTHKHRGSGSRVFYSIPAEYTQPTRHRKLHEERSPTDREKGHHIHTHRTVADRHTSHLTRRRGDTRPSMERTEGGTTHRRAGHQSEIYDWHMPHTARSRTHRSRAPSPGYRVVPTTRKTQGHWYR
jgi:hypothetical protein